MTSAMSKELIFCPGLEAGSFAKPSVIYEALKVKKPEIRTESEFKKRPVNVENKQIGLFEFRSKIVWFNAIGFLFMHLAGIYGAFLVLKDLFSGFFLSFIWMIFLAFMGGEGITVGAHRLWSHRSYKATMPLQIILIIMQTLAGQNCCYVWARDHRLHHKYSDTDADPHNASRGFFFSHIGWLMMKKHPEVIIKGKGIDMSDLEANPVIMFQKKYYKPMYFVIAMIIPVLPPMYLWNETLWKSIFINFFCRYILLLNITWSVNSVAHMFGTKPYDNNILPVESTFVSFIGLGEGWHNYHHVFPWDYKASEFGMSLNFTTRLIEWLAKVGLAYDLKEASHKVMESRIKRSGDGSHPLYGNNKYSKLEDDKYKLAYRLKHLGKECDREEDTKNKS